MGKYYPKNALQHDDSCVVNFLKIVLTGMRSRVRKTANLILLALYFILKLTFL